MPLWGQGSLGLHAKTALRLDPTSFGHPIPYASQSFSHLELGRGINSASASGSDSLGCATFLQDGGGRDARGEMPQVGDPAKNREAPATHQLPARPRAGGSSRLARWKLRLQPWNVPGRGCLATL